MNLLRAVPEAGVQADRKSSSPSSLLLLSLELSDTKVYEPYVRALLETASYFCEVVVLKLSGVPATRVARRGCADRPKEKQVQVGAWGLGYRVWECRA